jgi:hypothetical protein
MDYAYQPFFPADVGTTGGIFIYSEELKPVSYVLAQLVSGGIARTGVSSAKRLLCLYTGSSVYHFAEQRNGNHGDTGIKE